MSHSRRSWNDSLPSRSNRAYTFCERGDPRGCPPVAAEIVEREARAEALRRAVEVGVGELDRAEGRSAEGVFKPLLDRVNRSEAA